MKKILCFGDSNTFGFIPENGKRYPENIRWTGKLGRLLGASYEIVEAGCNNRTCFSDNPAGFEQTGYKILPSLLSVDLDCVVLAIGINDLQSFFRPNSLQIKNGVENMVKIVRKKCPSAKILLLSPSVLTQDILSSFFAGMFDEVSIDFSHKLAEIYRKIADENDCRFLDLNLIAKVSKIDGLHYEPEAHEQIAHAVFGKIAEICP